MLRYIDIPDFGIIESEDDAVTFIKMTNLHYESGFYFFIDLLPKIAKDHNLNLVSLQYWVASNCIIDQLDFD